MIDGQVAGRYYNPAGRNISGNLSSVLDSLSNRQTQAVSRDATRQNMDIQNEALRKQALIEDFSQIKSLLEAGESGQAIDVARRRVEVLSDNGLDPSHSLDLISRIQTNPESALAGVNAVLAKGQAAGYGPKTVSQPADLVRFNSLVEIVENPDNYSEERVNAARVELGSLARAGTQSATERIAGTPGQTEAVAASEGQIEGAKAGAREDAKGRSQLGWRVQLESKLAKAREEAKAQGQRLTEVNAMQATLPTLKESVQALKDLAPIATYTIGGRAFDNVVKELGFGSTKGGDARAKFISIVDNQTLPLLRQTFGAAFTAEEGERLRRAFADPDATPTQKIEQLDAFIAQKERDILAGQRELGMAETTEDPLGIR